MAITSSKYMSQCYNPTSSKCRKVSHSMAMSNSITEVNYNPTSSKYGQKIVHKICTNKEWKQAEPSNYKIEKCQEIGKFLVLRIKYPDCTNYEGNKILVFYNVTLLDLCNQKLIDPHFCDNAKYFHPIARFITTDAGWAMATTFAQSMDASNKRLK